MPLKSNRIVVSLIVIIIFVYFAAGLALPLVPLLSYDTPATEAYAFFNDAYGVRSDAVMEVRGDFDDLKPIVNSFADFREVTQLVWYGTIYFIPQIPGVTDLEEVKKFLAYEDNGETVYRILMLLNVPPWETDDVYLKAETALTGFACNRVGLTDAVVSGKADLLSEAGEGFWEEAMLVSVPLNDLSHAAVSAAVNGVKDVKSVFSPFSMIKSEPFALYILNDSDLLKAAKLDGTVGETEGVKYVLYVVLAPPSSHAAVTAALKAVAPSSRVLSVEMGRKDIRHAATAMGKIVVDTLFTADMALCIAFLLRAYARSRKLRGIL